MKSIVIKFSNASIEASYDDTLVQFLDSIPDNSAEQSDIRVLSTYFQVQWPMVKPPRHDLYKGYSVVSGKKHGQKKR